MPGRRSSTTTTTSPTSAAPPATAPSPTWPPGAGSANITIFEPEFLRLILAHHRAGALPRAKIQLYLGGDRMLFGLPANPTGLNAYLEMLEGTGLPWMVAVYGGDVVGAGLARLAVERGGHVRVGLEDHHAPPRTPRNEELVREAVELAHAGGRRPATPDEVPETSRGNREPLRAAMPSLRRPCGLDSGHGGVPPRRRRPEGPVHAGVPELRPRPGAGRKRQGVRGEPE